MDRKVNEHGANCNTMICWPDKLHHDEIWAGLWQLQR